MPFTINALSLVTALVSLPLNGAWHADVSVSPAQGDQGVALSGMVTIELDGLTLVGTVVRSAVDDSMIRARIVAGAGGMSSELKEAYYKGSPTVRKVVEDILRETGETLSGASSAAVLDTVIGTWQRERGPAGVALSRIVEAYGGSWRSLPDGTVLVVGPEGWPVVEPKHTQVPGGDPIQGSCRIAWPERTPPDVLPGITFLGQQVSYVVHELAPGGLRTELRFVQPRTLLERMRALLARDEWHGKLWPAVVESQNADGTVDVVVGGKFGLTQVPLHSGVPGLRALVSQGQGLLVGFSADDPQKPFAALAPSAQGGDAKFGTLLYTVAGPLAAVPGLLLNAEFFEPTAAGDAALVVRLGIISASSGLLAPMPPPTGLPLTTSTVRVV